MKNRRIIKYAAFFSALLSVSSFAQVSYKTESKSNWSYICDADWEGGANHTKDSHTPLFFKPVTKIKLHHISMLPDAITDLIKVRAELVEKNFNTKRDAIKATYEKTYLKIVDIGKFRIEEKSYSLRKSDQDPNNFLIYSQCESFFDDGKLESISCHDSSRLFGYNANNNRFTYSEIGSWHSNSKKNFNDQYYGDSSFFSFGSCQKTYD